MADPRFANRWYAEVRVQELRQEIQALYDEINTLDAILGSDIEKLHFVRLNFSGGEVYLPDGWSVEAPSTGVRTITHDIGHSNYAVFPGPIAGSARSVTTNGLGDTEFTLNIFNSGGSNADANLAALVLEYPA